MIRWTSHLKKYDDCIKPAAKIMISGKAWKSETVLVTNIDVSISVGPEASTCTVDFTTTLKDFKGEKMELDSDLKKIKLGVKIEVSLGFFAEGLFGREAKLEKVFVGYICDIDIKVIEGEQVVVTIKGMDAKLWMMPSQMTDLKKEKRKISDVVANTVNNFIGKIDGKEIDIDDEPQLERMIFQTNESHFEFLSRLAELSGCFFYISVGKLYFKSISKTKNDGVIISPGIGIHEINITTSIWGQVKKVTHVSLSPKNFTKQIQGEFPSSTGISKSSLSSDVDAFCERCIVDNSIASKEEAEFRSKAIYDKAAIDRVQGRFLVAGIPDITVTSELKTVGFDQPVDNTYTITKIQHHCDLAGSDYTTEIEAGSSNMDALSGGSSQGLVSLGKSLSL